MSYKIQMNDETAVAQVINQLGVGIPLELGIRELVVNGIEACLRNKEEDSKGVWVCKDHIHTNKFSVVNSGGDYLSEKIFRDNLATLGNTGNVSRGGERLLDENKGIGAKVSILPKMRDGLIYRSREKDQELGIMAQMCENRDKSIYELPAFQCEYSEEITSWPYTENFSSFLDNSTGTEVVCMGEYSEEDTWLKFDQSCGQRKGNTIGGTGYGIFRYLTHRIWNEPQVSVRVGIYDKKKNKLIAHKKVEGLKHFMENRCKKHGSININVEGIDFIANWSIIQDYGDEGYSSNWSASGKTAIAWKGEVYSEFHQHHKTVKKELNECGIIVKWQKVMIIFEVASNVKLQTNAGRTEVFHKGSKIDKFLLHEEFRNNMPQELKEWQEENQVKNIDDADLAKELKKIFKDMGFTPSLVPTSKPPLKLLKQPSPPSLPGSPSGNKKSVKVNKKIDSLRNLKNCVQPNYVFIDDDEAPLCEFHLTEYKMLINIGSPLYEYRKERILKSLQEVCLVKDLLDFNLKKHIFINACYRIFETNIFGKDDTLETRKEKWKPECLESNWNVETEKSILKIIRKKNEEQKKIA